MATGRNASVQLVELFEKAVKAAERVEEDETDEAEEARCVEALKAMRSLTVTTALLMDTQVGKRLRKLTKHKNAQICSVAQELIDAWKKVVATEAAAKHSSTGSAVKQSPAKESLKSPGLQSPSLKSLTKVQKVVKRDSTTVVKAESTHVVKRESTIEVKISGKVAAVTTGNGPLKLGNVPKSGDASRDRIRELLVDAFSKVLSEAEDQYLHEAKEQNIAQVAVTVESAMFKKLGPSSSNAHKHNYRSLMFNLKDPNNPDLRRRVLIGEIEPEKLLTMTVEDMASDERKLQNQKIKEKALFECERGLKAAASTDQFKCAKCKQRQCTYFQMQTRSADEPMTTFVTCVNCNNHWKFC